MAKFAIFFRRLFTSFNSDDDEISSSSIPDTRRSVIITPSVLTPLPISKTTTPNTSHSCSASPRPAHRTITKQTTIQIDSYNNGNPNSNLLLSNTYKYNRRLSAPLIIHASTHHRKQRSAIVDESTEEALISPLQRLSLSSTTGNSVHHNNSVNSLGTSIGSVNASPRIDPHSMSLNLSSSNSINLPSSLTNISPSSGRY
jgi:hypothetical protein